MTLLALGVATALATPPRDLPGAVMPDRHWDFEHLDLTVRIDPDARTVAGTAVHRARRVGAPHGWLRLHAVALDIAEVTVDGAVVEGTRVARDHVDVPVPADRDAVEVAVRWTAAPETGMHFRGGRGTPDGIVEVWTQGEDHDNRHWFPSWDYPNDTFTVSTTIEAPDGLTALANGALLGTEPTSDGWKRWRYALEQPIVSYLVAIAVGDYRVVSDSARVPLEYVVPKTLDDEAARATFGTAAAMMPWFEELLGTPYPYPVYRQVLTQRFMYGGMENASLTTMTDELAVTPEDPRSVPAERVVAHELAHQWFGDLLTCYGWRELWLNEGFATYYAARWHEHEHGAAEGARLVHRWHEAALWSDHPMAARSWSRTPGRDSARVYNQGAAVLRMLEVHLGRAVFDRAIRTYVADNAHRLVESEDLRRALEDASGEHLGWLFDQWVFGRGAAKLESRVAFDDGSLEVAITQGDEPYGVPVEVEVGLEGGETRRHRIRVEGEETRLVVPLDAPPAWVAVDPRGGVLADWKHHREPAEWIAQLRHSAEPYARLVAARALGKSDASEAVIGALRGVLRDSGEPDAVRRACAVALGALGGEAATDALVDSIDVRRERVREEVVDALGSVARTDAAVVALGGVVRTDGDPVVRASALWSLGALDGASALPLARSIFRRPDPTWDGVLHEAAAEVLGDHGTAADLALLSRALDPAVRRPQRHAAGWAVAAWLDEAEPEVRERRAPGVARVLEPWLTDGDVRSREQAVGLLGRIGDETSARRLTAFAKATTLRYPDLRGRALDAARLIRSRGEEEPEDAEDLERIRAEVEALEERLERLEEWR